MTPYFDSGVLIKLYVLEPDSAAAAKSVAQFPFIQISPFHELEIRSTLRALEGRRVITDNQRASSEHMFDRDMVAGNLRMLAPDWSVVFKCALDLSRDFTAATLARSLDIIHVATAVAWAAPSFVTGDQRQAATATAAGLTVERIV